MVLIRVSGVSKSFDRGAGRSHLLRYLFGRFRGENQNLFWALKNVSFQVNEHESLAIIGANGAGKSTMLSLIAGLVQPDEGYIEVAGSTATLLESDTPRKAGGLMSWATSKAVGSWVLECHLPQGSDDSSGRRRIGADCLRLPRRSVVVYSLG